MFSVLEKKLLTDLGKGMIRKYEDTSDAYNIIKDLKTKDWSGNMKTRLTHITSSRT